MLNYVTYILTLIYLALMPFDLCFWLANIVYLDNDNIDKLLVFM